MEIPVIIIPLLIALFVVGITALNLYVSNKDLKKKNATLAEELETTNRYLRSKRYEVDMLRSSRNDWRRLAIIEDAPKAVKKKPKESDSGKCRDIWE